MFDKSIMRTELEMVTSLNNLPNKLDSLSEYHELRIKIENNLKNGNSKILDYFELDENAFLGIESYDNNSPYGFYNNAKVEFYTNMSLFKFLSKIDEKYYNEPDFFTQDIIEHYLEFKEEKIKGVLEKLKNYPINN